MNNPAPQGYQSQAPATPPTGPAGGAPTRSAGRTMLATVIAVVVVTGAISAWLLMGKSYDTSTPRGAAEQFAAAVNDRNYDQVNELSCSRLTRGMGESGSSALGDDLLGKVTLEVQDAKETGNREGEATFKVNSPMGATTFRSQMRQDESNERWQVCPDLNSIGG